MDAVVAFCVACLNRGLFCPACGSVLIISKNGHTKKIDFRIQSPEEAPERLIEVIQNISGNVPKEKREAAAVELIKRFKYLIQSIVNKLFYGYELQKKYGYEYQDFFQDALTEFCDLVLHDFRIKENPNAHDNTGLAPFGSYIKTKLYRRVQWRMEQKLEKRYGWRNEDGKRFNHEVVVDYMAALDGRKLDAEATTSPSERAFFYELNGSVLSNVFSCDDQVLDDIKDEKIKAILDELIAISENEKIVPSRDGEIWRMYYLSGKIAVEIGEHMRDYNNPEIARTVGQTRVRQVAKLTNTKIIAEFGKRSAMRNSGMKI